MFWERSFNSVAQAETRLQGVNESGGGSPLGHSSFFVLPSNVGIVGILSLALGISHSTLFLDHCMPTMDLNMR